MNRNDFMHELRTMLGELAVSEREEALSYYENYFDDAGPDNEARIIREFGSPGRLAAIIKEGVYGSESGFGSASKNEESSFNGNWDDSEQKSEKSADANFSQEYTEIPYEERVKRAQDHSRVKKNRNGERVILFILLAIIFFPALIAIFSTTVGVMTGLFGSVLGLFTAGLVLLVSGIVLCFSNMALGIGSIGIALLCLGLGFLALAVTIWVCGWLFPRIIRLIRKGFHRFSGKDGVSV